MKRILLLVPYGSVGGMERLALTFYDYLKSKGYKVKVIKLIKLKSDIINFGDDEIYLSVKDFSEMSLLQRLMFYMSVPYKYNRLIKKHKIDNSIAFGDMCNLFSSLSYTKESKIASIHALKSIELKGGSLFDSFVKWGYRNSYKKFEKVVCISHAIKDDLINNCGYSYEENLRVIYNPHDIIKIQALAKEEKLNNDELEIFNKYDVVLFLGRFSGQKALWHMVRSFKQVVKLNSNARLVFIGSGSEESQKLLCDLIAKHDLNAMVYFLGIKSNPYPYLKRAKVLALTSYYEGTPNVIIESIALGTPVISTSCTLGIWELMCLDWKNNFKDDFEESIRVEAGYITPNMFSGDFAFDVRQPLIRNEEVFSNTLIKVFEKREMLKDSILEHSEELLGKYEVGKVVKSYLDFA